ncbi:hypothetical protein J2X31_000847 [Flavobacterium arsenatis]|uniref:DUF695 domain-containing protein n=1 Tax=Flavobacterium arsenatis TaxID=1484332 RepID=A0ABU1TN37_9FLAO|nr:DUF695 domain-containing protein [Flavobacterium arsenatis]MDR6966847.1 hypothetical protein [Flavobacterium arsenatis]
MGFLNNLFGKKHKEQISTYEDFWDWFKSKEQDFFNIVKTGRNIEAGFFKQLSPKLEELQEGFFYLTGMYDDQTVELIFTPDGALKNVVFVEELVASAPIIPNWKFTALKQPAQNIDNIAIEMSDYSFNSENLSFFPVEHKNYPDEVDITIVYDGYKEEDNATITNGVYIFLDNYLGELNFLTTIDNLAITSKEEIQNELIHIAKLKDYLIWREKEFVERYKGTRYNTENDSYASLEAELHNGLPLVAIINTTLLEWDSKASHPWILKIEINYDGKNNNGMPDNDTYQRLNAFEDELMLDLKDSEGYLNVGRETANSERNIYFACKDYRKPSKILADLIKKHIGTLDISYVIYKDKYWQSFERFRPN